MKYLTAIDASSVIGVISPPVQDPFYGGDVSTSLGTLISTGIQLTFFVAGFAALIYLLWGAYDWVTSSGEKEKLKKAQDRMQSAVIGLVLLVVMVVVFNVIMGTVLGGKFGFSNGPNGLQFTLPHL